MPPPDRAAEIGAAVSHVWPSMIPPPPPPPPRSPLLRPSEVTLPSNQSPHSSKVNRVTPKPSTLRRSATDFTTANLIRQAHASDSGSDDTDSIVDVIKSAEVVELRRPQEHSMPVITERQSDTEPGAPGVLIHLPHTSRHNSVNWTDLEICTSRMCLQKERSNFRTFESDICQLIRDEAKQSKVLVAMVNVIDALEGKFDPTSDDDIDVYCDFLEHRDRAFKSMQMTLHQVLGAGALVVWRRFEKLIRKVLFTGDLNVTVAEYLDQALATPPLHNRLAEVEMSWLKNKDEQDITLWGNEEASGVAVAKAMLY